MIPKKLSLLLFLLSFSEVQVSSAQGKNGLEGTESFLTTSLTETATAVETTKETEPSLPLWMMITAGMGYVVGAAGIVLAYRSRRQRKGETPPQPSPLPTADPVPTETLLPSTPEGSKSGNAVEPESRNTEGIESGNAEGTESGNAEGTESENVKGTSSVNPTKDVVTPIVKKGENRSSDDEKGASITKHKREAQHPTPALVFNSLYAQDFTTWDEKKMTRPQEQPIVLVVANDARLFSLLTLALEGSYQVRKTALKETAFEMAKRIGPHLILCEEETHENRHRWLMKNARADEQLRMTPAILCSRHIKQALANRTHKDGFHAVWGISSQTASLLKAVRYLISEHSTAFETVEEEVEEERWLKKAREHVEQNLSRPELSVEELSRTMGMSRVHLYNKLLEQTGETPIEYIRNMRLERAAALLQDKELSIAEVAEKVGYNNPKAFTKYFKEKYGIVPSAFQKEL